MSKAYTAARVEMIEQPEPPQARQEQDVPILFLHDIERHYRQGDETLHVLSGIELALWSGQSVALVAPSGAGKSTLLKAVSGLIPVTTGVIRFQGREITRLTAADRVRAGIVHVPEGRQIFSGMTVAQNLRLGATALPDRARIDALFERVYTLFPRLAERRRQSAGTLSGGERQMLALGRALMSEPQLLMLDEPSLGLAPAVVEALYDTLKALHRDGLTLLLAEQSIPLALGIADYGYVLQTGRVALEGPAARLRDDAQVQEIYLGVSARAAPAG